MKLEERLEEYKKSFQKQAPAAAQEIMHRATEDLKNSGILSRTVKVGDVAPDFTLKDAQGRDVALGELLDSGPVVIGFYRGRW